MTTGIKNDITFILVTKNRPHLLREKIANLELYGLNYIIADGTKNNLLYIIRLYKASLKLKTKYVMVITDDDIYYIESIYRCIDFLDKNEEYISCQGKFIGSNYNKPRYTNARTIDDDGFIDRLLTIQKDLFVMFYSVFRTDVFKKVLHVSRHLKDITTEDYTNRLNEFLFNLIPIIYGKHKELNYLYCKRTLKLPNNKFKEYICASISKMIHPIKYPKNYDSI